MTWWRYILLLYVLFFAAPIAITAVSVYQWLEWMFGFLGRGVPKRAENALIWVVDTVSIPVPEVADAIPEESA